VDEVGRGCSMGIKMQLHRVHTHTHTHTPHTTYGETDSYARTHTHTHPRICTLTFNILFCGSRIEIHSPPSDAFRMRKVPGISFASLNSAYEHRGRGRSNARRPYEQGEWGDNKVCARDSSH
jgi:hypothetical protein